MEEVNQSDVMILENVSGENAVKTESQLAVYKKKLEIADQ